MSSTTCRIYLGDNVEVMAGLDAESVDAVVCDPPYGLEFMGRAWDKLGGDAGMSKPGIGERDTAWPAYGGDPPGGANPTCATCGGRKRGRYRCECEDPEWRVKGVAAVEHNSGAAQQAWHARWAVEALRVLKPGGHCVAFGGTRTYHRLVCALEDAGFEIRDSLHWMYGSGFPKSLDVSKAIDRELGAPRAKRATGAVVDRTALDYGGATGKAKNGLTDEYAPEAPPHTPEAAAWEGYGTALKPAQENVTWAQKPWTTVALLTTIGSCLSSLYASIAEWPSTCPPAASPLVRGASALAPVPTPGVPAMLGATTPTGAGGASSAPTATSPFGSVTATSLRIVLSWQNTLDAISEAMNTSTTATDSEQTTDLKTLLSCLSQTTPESIIQAATNPDGPPAPVCRVDESFGAVLSKWSATLTLSALVHATLQERTAHLGVVGEGSVPHRPIVLARKPLIGTVAANVLRYGTGALNIDATRVGINPGYRYNADRNGTTFHGEQGNRIPQSAVKKGAPTIESTQGRWPPNLLLTHSAPIFRERVPDRIYCQYCQSEQPTPDLPEDRLCFYEFKCTACGERQEAAYEQVQVGGCRRVGTKRIKGSGTGAVKRASSADAEGNTGAALGAESRPAGTPMINHVDPDGLETVEAWICSEDCPVRLLDEQSGERSVSGVAKSGKAAAASNTRQGATSFDAQKGSGTVHNDSGGASRFYPAFSWDPEYDLPGLYCAKASTSEREAGLTEENMICSCKLQEQSWESADPEAATPAELATSQPKATIGSTTQDNDGIGTPTISSGSSTTDLFPKATKFTTETTTSSTTTSSTSVSSTTSPTSESTVPILSNETVHGGANAPFAANGSPLRTSTGTSTSKDGSATDDVAPATSKSSPRRSAPDVCSVCGKMTQEAYAKKIASGQKHRFNGHPTVKPVAVMRWLLRLVVPPGGVVLDPFAGSGTTGVAAKMEGFKSILIEQDPESVQIAIARVQHASKLMDKK